MFGGESVVVSCSSKEAKKTQTTTQTEQVAVESRAEDKSIDLGTTTTTSANDGANNNQNLVQLSDHQVITQEGGYLELANRYAENNGAVMLHTCVKEESGKDSIIRAHTRKPAPIQHRVCGRTRKCVRGLL